MSQIENIKKGADHFFYFAISIVVEKKKSPIFRLGF